jgi:hypothetical protein
MSECGEDEIRFVARGYVYLPLCFLAPHLLCELYYFSRYCTYVRRYTDCGSVLSVAVFCLHMLFKPDLGVVGPAPATASYISCCLVVGYPSVAASALGNWINAMGQGHAVGRCAVTTECCVHVERILECRSLFVFCSFVVRGCGCACRYLRLWSEYDRVRCSETSGGIYRYHCIRILDILFPKKIQVPVIKA